MFAQVLSIGVSVYLQLGKLRWGHISISGNINFKLWVIENWFLQEDFITPVKCSLPVSLYEAE